MYEIEKENWKKTLQVKGLEEKQFRNYRICLEPNKVYDEYFHHGIWGKDEALEGIIYFTNKDKQSENNENDQLEELIKNSKAMLTQFYRFIDLNDEDRVSDFYKVEQRRGIDEKLEEKIKRKIQQLQETKDDYMFISNRDRANYRKSDEEIRHIKEQKAVEKIVKNKVKELISYGQNIGDNERRKIHEEESKRYFGENKLKIKENRISYSIRERFRYAHFPEYSLEDDLQPYIIRHWTENIYDILKYLQTLEQNDKVEYYRLWLDTRIQRLKNRMGFQTEEKKKEIEQEIQALEETEKKIEAIQEKRKAHEGR